MTKAKSRSYPFDMKKNVVRDKSNPFPNGTHIRLERRSYGRAEKLEFGMYYGRKTYGSDRIAVRVQNAHDTVTYDFRVTIPIEDVVWVKDYIGQYPHNIKVMRVESDLDWDEIEVTNTKVNIQGSYERPISDELRKTFEKYEKEEAERKAKVKAAAKERKREADKRRREMKKNFEAAQKESDSQKVARALLVLKDVGLDVIVVEKGKK